MHQFLPCVTFTLLASISLGCASASSTGGSPSAAASGSPAANPTAEPASGPIKVEVVGQAGQWQLLRGGKPYFVKGGGGSGSPALLAQLGGNSGRTWGAEELETRLAEAQKHGITLAAGIWLGHPRHGFNYNDPEQVAKQVEATREAILKYKDHPAVLVWGIGNEMEGEGDNAAIWSAINNLAAMCKKLDPNHPTMTVIAEIGKRKIEFINRLCPDVDIIGINTYGTGPTLGERYRAAGGVKPFIVTEFGPTGTWELPRNSFGAPEEPTSTKKAEVYRKTYERTVLGSPGMCLGSYAFIWGNKVEATSTWFGMLLPDKPTPARLAAADTLSELWTGKPLTNRCPVIEPLVASSQQGAPGANLSITLKATDPEGDPLTVEWTLRGEIGQYETGGDPTAPPPTFQDSLLNPSLTGVTVRLPSKPGKYRLYAYIRDGKGGAATATLPLLSGDAPPAKGK